MIGPNDIHTAARLFDRERLTLARELRGLTKLELAEKIGKTPSAVSQFESGRARPDGQTVGRIVLALAMPAGFFANSPDAIPYSLIALDHCHFRSLRSASQRDRRMLLAHGSMICGLLSFLERKVSLPVEQVTPLAALPKDLEGIETLATDVRRRWGLGLGPIGNMTNLLERHGVVVIPIEEACREVDAFSLWNERRPTIFLVMEKGSTSRTRMDASHELGHLLMHADVAAGSPQLERQATHFGSAFLMPRDSFFHEAPSRIDWDHVWELKRRWKVSGAAIVRRSYDLGVISEAAYRRAFMHLNQTGEREREPHEPLHEHPASLRKALDVIAAKWPLPRIADELGITASELHNLVAFTDPAPLPTLPAPGPPGPRDDGPLFASCVHRELPDVP